MMNRREMGIRVLSYPIGSFRSKSSIYLLIKMYLCTLKNSDIDKDKNVQTRMSVCQISMFPYTLQG